MKILLGHNFYQVPGGEDVVFNNEKLVLEKHGHEIVLFEKYNKNIEISGVRAKLNFFKNTVWSKSSAVEISKIIKEFRPDIAHFTNTFPQISPSVYYVLKNHGVPVIQNIQNFRLLCPGAYLMRDNKICEECIHKKIVWPSVKYGCYRKSRLNTLVLLVMLAFHRFLRTYQNYVDLYVVSTQFSKEKLLEAGFPEKKIVVKPNFLITDPLPTTNSGQYALFVGRLSEEKGIRTLLSAWEKLKHIPLKITGTGPLLEKARQLINDNNFQNIEILGFMSKPEIYDVFKNARFLIFPSEWYEGFPLTIIEAFACGIPVIASKLGAMDEKITNYQNGIHFNPGDATDLAAKVTWAWSHPQEMQEMGRAARREFETKYTAERNYEILMGIYQKALAKK